MRTDKVPLPNPIQYDDVQEDTNTPTDPYFPMQWYLRNTGQNGGKVHLDLNVQAAWDQGITGKNVTTAIMDDGKPFHFHLLDLCDEAVNLFKSVTKNYFNSI